MNIHDELSPLGTVAERLRAARVLPETTRPAGLPEFPERLVSGLAEYDLDATPLQIAWELARCVDGLAPEGRDALMALWSALLVSLSRGSTRLPIAGPEAESYTVPLVDKLGGAGTAERALALLRDPRLDVILRRRDELPPPGLEKPLLLDGNHLYAQRMSVTEARVVAALRARLADAEIAGIDEARVRAALGEVLERPVLSGPRPVFLSEEQQYAVLSAACRRFVVVTGGPGTGKTSIVVSILRVLLRLGIAPEAIAMATPTGKAANRMQESVERTMETLTSPDDYDAQVMKVEAPRTLHRLLGYSQDMDRYKRDEKNPLDEEVVIVDECSMIDVAMMDRILRAVKPTARLILLGDAEQLPSVEAGVVFRDLVPPGSGGRSARWRSWVRPTTEGRLEGPESSGSQDPRWGCAVRLQHSYRMDTANPAGRNIYLVAQEINAGRAETLVAEPGVLDEKCFTARASLSDVRGEGAELLYADSPASIGAFLDHWWKHRITCLGGFAERIHHAYRRDATGFVADEVPALDALFNHYESHRLLCVTRGPGSHASAHAANRHLHARLRTYLGSSGVAEYEPGDPVMVGRNDYQRMLFNGDQGLVLWVAGEDGGSRPMAVFRRGRDFVGFDVRTLRSELSLSYAITVHKSQGSEFDRVAMLLPEGPLELCSRELVYTAVTRSKVSALLVGKRDVLEASVRRGVERFSGVGEGLERGAGAGEPCPPAGSADEASPRVAAG